MYEFISSDRVENRQLTSLSQSAFENLYGYIEQMKQQQAILVFFDGSYHCFRIKEVRVLSSDGGRDTPTSIVVLAWFLKLDILKIRTLHIKAVTRDNASVCDLTML